MMHITFKKSELQNLAIYVSQLVRESVVFEIVNNGDSYTVNLTGGF